MTNSTMRLLTVCFFSALVPRVTADDSNPAARWEPTIQKFEAQDAEAQPATGGVLFVGSSSIRMWDTGKWFPDHGVINRGFGGSQISDVNYFADRIVHKYKPRVIAFYAGDNDIAKGKSPETVLADFQTFTTMLEKHLPETQLIYIPIKPSLKRWQLWPKMKVANGLICKHLATRAIWHYADIATPMLGKDGRPIADLFASDGLHLNEKGYEVWTNVIRPILDRAESQPRQQATGIVFHDANGNGRHERGEAGIAGIRVSNGREIVTTDEQGRYKLPVSDDTILFVVKPAGWRTPLDKELMLPRFYYIHKPAGSPKNLRFPGVSPTGPLPESVDFPLYPQKEPDKFQAILFGDPQPRDQKEVDYIAHDVVEELIGTKASFGVTLGDIVFDDLSMFKPQAQAIALLGIPWYNVIGNHDINFSARNDRDSDETFERHFGPAYYSFDYGTAHFVVLDDIEWVVDNPPARGRYQGGFGVEQLDFVRNDLALVPEDQLVVLMMHIPLPGVQDRQALYRLIEQRPFCISISGHTHHHEHRFITDKDGWRGPKPHHHIINVTVSGSWWSGSPDERGIPHTLMADGAPNGYSIISFDGQKYALDFRAAGRPAKYQMNIHAPEVVASADSDKGLVYANVFNGSERSTVEMRVGKNGVWTTMQRKVAIDPFAARLFDFEQAITNHPWRNMSKPKPSTHLWHAKLPSNLPPGVHAIEIRATDSHGRQHLANRSIRVK